MAPKKRRSLDEQLDKRNAPVTTTDTPTPVPGATPRPQAKLNNQPGSRSGKKAISGFYEPEVARQLKVLAAANDRTVQGLLGEALNLLFEKYGLDAIAQSDE